MTETHAARRHELLATFAEQVAQLLIEKHGFELDKASDLGNDLADWMATHYGGQNMYFTKDEGFKRDARDQQIFARLRRGNADELATEFGISYVRVHQIYRRLLTEARKARQPDLLAGIDQDPV